MTASMAQRAEQPDRPVTGIYMLDPVHTFVLFSARHLVIGRVVGRFVGLIGTLAVTTRLEDWAVSTRIEVASLTTGCAKRDEDLRGPDFFDATQYPTIRFEGHTMRPANDHWIMNGALTIRDLTVPVALDVWFRGTANTTPPRAGFHASTTVRRADFGMKRDLITEIGTSASPDVTIEIDAEATLTTTSTERRFRSARPAEPSPDPIPATHPRKEKP
jgi:polyisoprenoid-binding protein YceI